VTPLDARTACDRALSRARDLRIGREARWVWLAVVAFVGMSVWWLTQDDRVPDYDSGTHEFLAAVIHNELASGQLLRPFTDYTSYPPLVHFVGALAIFAAGLHPMALILASNIVFVPLLAFGCYGTARIAYGPRAGLLAAIVALGAPMVVSTMHEYYLDTPQAAMVAVSVWALLASRHFERVGIAVLAGVLSGLALLTKETSVVFLAGIVIVAALRAGRERRRGVLAYALAVCVVSGPWYVYHAADLGTTFGDIGNAVVDSEQSPARFSLASFEWYGWDLVNQQVLAPFALAFAVGIGTALWRLVRRPLRAGNLEPELLGGAFFSYLGMTLLLHKDPRYTLPALVFVAVLATGWIATLPRRRLRGCLSAAVVALAALYFVGMSTGIGGSVRIELPGAQQTMIYENQLTLYQTIGWLRGAPAHDGDVQALLAGLRSDGIREIVADTDGDPLDFNESGLRVMVLAQGMTLGDAGAFPAAREANLIRTTPAPGLPAPCQRLDDGSLIYAVQGRATGLDTTAMRDPGRPGRRYTLLCPGRAAVTVP
jgi:4-amino-4-deoxy-L-arabinose transferase-like glycosyltransferase